MSPRRVDTVLIDTLGGETRIALMAGPKLLALHVDRGQPAEGDLLWGRVGSRIAGMDAVAVRLPQGPDGLLAERRSGDRAMREGDPVLVQVTRPARDDKGPKLAMRLRLEGRGLVYTPGQAGLRIGRDLVDAARQAQIAAVLSLQAAPGEGWILRRAGAGWNDDALAAEAAWLRAQWQAVSTPPAKLPAAAWQAPRSGMRALADLDAETLRTCLVDGDLAEVKARLAPVAPAVAARLTVHGQADGLFTDYGVEEEIDRALADTVALPGGGRVIFGRTAALTAIDIDTAGASGEAPSEALRHRLNLAAAAEIADQIKLRGVSGLIVVDALKLRSRADWAALVSTYRRHFADEAEYTQISGPTRAGLIEITRQRRAVDLAGLYLAPAAPRPSAAAAAFAAARQGLLAARMTPGVPISLRVSLDVARALDTDAANAWAALRRAGVAVSRVVVPEALPGTAEVTLEGGRR